MEPKTTLHSRSLRRARRSPSARVLVLCAATVATALVTAAAAQSKPQRSLQSPQVDQIARAFRPITDKQVALSAVPNGFWGGQYRIATGESVTVYASNSYPVDPALGQRWADFLGTLVHGAEISTVTVLIATPSQIARTCGSDAVACYSAQGAFLYTPGDDPGSDLSAEAVITHEYGHHVAANRSDAPWPALDWGPKRWASAMQVCAKAKSGVLVPGAEDPVQYTENPGEGWAETYRVLNERKAGRAETPWDIVSDAMYPTAADLAAAEQDVTNPWTRDTVTTQTGRVHGYDSEAHVHDRHPARWVPEGDAEALGRNAPRARRVRRGQACCAHRIGPDRLSRDDGLRHPELPGAGERTQRARQCSACGLEALAPAS